MHFIDGILHRAAVTSFYGSIVVPFVHYQHLILQHNNAECGIGMSGIHQRYATVLTVEMELLTRIECICYAVHGAGQTLSMGNYATLLR